MPVDPGWFSCSPLAVGDCAYFSPAEFFPRGVNDPHGIALPFRQRWLRYRAEWSRHRSAATGFAATLFLVVKVLTQQQSAVIGIGDAVVEARLK